VRDAILPAILKAAANSKQALHPLEHHVDWNTPVSAVADRKSAASRTTEDPERVVVPRTQLAFVKASPTQPGRSCCGCEQLDLVTGVTLPAGFPARRGPGRATRQSGP
jgi:hypothetical protein